MKEYMSIKTLYELQELRAEMRKPEPDGEKIFKLLCGNKYNIPINEKCRS